MTLFLHSKSIWQAGVQAVQPANLLPDWIKHQQWDGPVNVLAVGKAACAMAKATVSQVSVAQGLVITKQGHALPVPSCTVLTADHPVPGQASLTAADDVLTFIDNCHQMPDTPVWVLLSGGASSLLADVPPSISLEDWQWLNHRLLASGLPIDAINHCRRALGTLKGGKLLDQLGPIPVTTLAISDVLGDNPSIIGSGPTYPPDLGTVDLDAILPQIFPQTCPQQFRLEPLLRQGWVPARPLTAQTVDYHIIGSAQKAVDSAKNAAIRLGYQTHVVAQPLQGWVDAEAARIADTIAQAVSEPTCYLFWGEPTIQLPAKAGLGGRNQHLALSLVNQLKGNLPAAWHALVGGTDGTDGPTDAAGGWVDNHTWQKSLTMQVDIPQALSEADSYTALKTLHQLWITGPTQTNVMDLVVVLRMP